MHWRSVLLVCLDGKDKAYLSWLLQPLVLVVWMCASLEREVDNTEVDVGYVMGKGKLDLTERKVKRSQLRTREQNKV